MSKIKLGIVAIAAVFVFSAVASSAASAATAGWMVNGTMLNGSAALANTAKVHGSVILESTTLVVVCTGQNLIGVNPVISSPAMGSATSLEFTSCSLTSGGGCSLATSTIKTNPLLVEVTLDGALAAKGTFSPQTKTIFTELEIVGESCALLGKQAVTGKAEVLDPEGQDEKTIHLIKSVGASGLLKIGSGAAVLLGDALLQLASGQTWSFL